jgi:hypothetical protein
MVGFGVGFSNWLPQYLQTFALNLIISEHWGHCFVVLPLAIAGKKKTRRAKGPIRKADKPHPNSLRPLFLAITLEKPAQRQAINNNHNILKLP